MKRIVLTLLLAFTLAGCSFNDMNLDNPFDSSPAKVDDIYFGQFPDVPIPRDMTLNPAKSFVSAGQDGSQIGLQTFSGRLDRTSLARAMVYNMVRNGWALLSVSSGNKILQLYSKDNRFAVLYIYDQTTNVALEVWVSSRLAEGAYRGEYATGTSGVTPITPLAPPASTGSGSTIQEEVLMQ